jgi:hypothetical protein
MTATEARGICSTGRYKTCLTCCATDGTISDRDRCSRGCGDFKDSPLQQLITEKKKAVKTN